jgi:hypothetical protein
MPNKSSRTIEYVIGALVVVLVILIVFLALNYRALRRSAVAGARQSWLSTLVAHHRGPATVADLASVRPWMTFDYLNRFFNLPPQYLQTQLAITDPQYPRLTIGGYAKRNHLDLATFQHQLDAALRARLVGAAPTSTSNTTGVPQGYL